MLLSIDTSCGETTRIQVRRKDKTIVEKIFSFQRAEKLLVSLDTFLHQNNIKLSDFREIKVNNRGGGFTSLRIGIAVANALAYALKIPVYSQENDPSDIRKYKDYNIVIPKYSKKPAIGKTKKSL